jgi:cytochrome c553
MIFSRVKLLFTSIFFTSVIIFSVSARPLSKHDMLQEIDKRLQKQTAKRDAIEAGRERALLCKSCHGEDGNSAKPDVPNLAGQNAGYLLDQISQFADGSRKDFVMNQLAANFSSEDKINVAIFYFSMPVKPQHVNLQLASKGETLYKSVCIGCHGREGLGHTSLARLAGQQVQYVQKVLSDFRNIANQGVSPSQAQRRSSTMENIVKNLSDEQIKELASYVAQLGTEDDH